MFHNVNVAKIKLGRGVGLKSNLEYALTISMGRMGVRKYEIHCPSRLSIATFFNGSVTQLFFQIISI
jgi:hypothetical protein